MYRGCSESNASMLVCFLPDEVLKWNTTQTRTQNKYFFFYSPFPTFVVSHSFSTMPPVPNKFSKPVSLELLGLFSKPFSPQQLWTFSWHVIWVSWELQTSRCQALPNPSCRVGVKQLSNLIQFLRVLTMAYGIRTRRLFRNLCLIRISI
jgi:hypothetical protein